VTDGCADGCVGGCKGGFQNRQFIFYLYIFKNNKTRL
jgi:hypothetical protein